MRQRRSGAQAILTPVIDLLSLLIVGFLTLGVMTGAVALPRGGSPSGAEAKIAHDDEKRRTAEALAAVEAQVARLDALVAEAESTAPDLADLTTGLEGRAVEIASLRAEREQAHARIAELEARLARAEQPDVGFATGWPIQDSRRKAADRYDLMLSQGRLLPVEEPYFDGSRDAFGVLSVRPVLDGLELHAALQKTSPVMTRILTDEFRRNGRVAMLVASDSFATFRVLREVLVREGVDFGWEPVETRTLRFSPTGREVVSQGPPR